MLESTEARLYCICYQSSKAESDAAESRLKQVCFDLEEVSCQGSWSPVSMRFSVYFNYTSNLIELNGQRKYQQYY